MVSEVPLSDSSCGSPKKVDYPYCVHISYPKIKSLTIVLLESAGDKTGRLYLYT